MDTSKLKKFAQYARRSLQEQMSNRLNTVLGQESAARREAPKAVAELEEQIRQTSKDQVVEKVAYIWFNRFCALRFMDVNGYTPIGIVSPEAGQFQPAILAEAKMGHMDSKVVPDNTQQQVSALLNGTATSQDPQGEAYRLLLVAACNYYHRSMSYLFKRITDYTELLMPDDLLSGNAILSYVQQAMTPDACKDVEIIGWLYQFYISEKKDQVFESLKKNKKITPENIPAATQLFTPHYIVRYLVENSLGRLWMLNNPNSTLIEKMDYYIKPVEVETDFLTVETPEALRICDPACGSGHMLSYAYDVLYAIYEEEGTDPSEIPGKILTHNLYGIELDERAGELASFALSMKAASGNPFEKKSNHRRFFRKPVEPNICILEKVDLNNKTLRQYTATLGRDLFSEDIIKTLQQFDEADNFGSLIVPHMQSLERAIESLKRLKKKAGVKIGDSEALSKEQQVLVTSKNFKNIETALKQADFLSSKYHVVIANPPYMGGKGMNLRLKKYAADNYKNSKSDLFAMFIERSLELALKQGQVGMITMQSWMFLSSFESLRDKLLHKHNLISMAQLGTRAFDSIGGEVVSTTAFIFERKFTSYTGAYIRLVEGKSEAEKMEQLLSVSIYQNDDLLFYRNPSDFDKIEGKPIAFYMSDQALQEFEDNSSFSDEAKACQGLATTDNNRFVRGWHELSFSSIAFECKNSEDAQHTRLKWFPFDKGGTFRKWYGNNEHVVNWFNDGQEIKQNIITKYPYLNGNPDFVAKNPSMYFRSGVTWSKITTGSFSARFSPEGAIFSDAGMKAFANSTDKLLTISGYFNSKVAPYFLSALSETINYEQGNIARLPYKSVSVSNHVNKLIKLTKLDWDSYELSWGFQISPMLKMFPSIQTINNEYRSWRKDALGLVSTVTDLESLNNSTFVKHFNLGSTVETVPFQSEISLNCNPRYRYGNEKAEEEIEALLLADTMREFISYAVGCMFGRYSLDKSGLILANQGDTLENYLKQVPQPSFMPDQENVIPILEDSWFTDDIVDRFRQFLKVTFGEEHFEENLTFIEKAIGKDIRKFFVKDFYTDHLKRYKKRPIYWLFSSPKGTFNALIYLHRYRPDTASVVLNDYLREFNTKLGEEKKRQEHISISASVSASEKTKALKQIDKLNKMLDEIDEYERDILFPLAAQQVEIDLDDGVKQNYKLFGKALKKVAGLS